MGKITKDYIAAFINGMAAGSTDTATIRSDALKFVTPSFQQRREGDVNDVCDLDGLVAILARFRGKTTGFEVDVQALVVAADERTAACRYVAWMNGDSSRKTTGTIFFDFDEQGKIEKLYEMVKQQTSAA